MPQLTAASFARLNSFLGHVNLGDYIIEGDLEAYSCKLAGIDKKLSRNLEQEVLESFSVSPQELATSPVGPLSSSASRKTLIYLILTLNHMYPDYDFSTLRAHHFCKEKGVAAVRQTIDNSLMETGQVWARDVGDSTPFLEALWSAIDEVIQLVDCDVYSYKSDHDGDPFGEKGAIWSFNYFFYNKKLKRILYFSCRCRSKLALDDASLSSEEGFSEQEDEGFVNDMDMDV
eukprot:TRINITY_DN721_c0_g1_i2.p1 TRINITY_DN721_c0_g1~~TRINITY_DN721_c0_g1_i2.p1  ORF type:complete len:231 (+),score=41.28 TRINITY_DN721_c0_g1_i2:277-969(+)